MSNPQDPASFRAASTKAYRALCFILVGVLLAIAVAGGMIGWSMGGWIGGLIGAATGLVCGAILTGIVWFAATLLWAMTQDGA